MLAAFVATNIILSRQNITRACLITRLLSRQKYACRFCRDKHDFVATKVLSRQAYGKNYFFKSSCDALRALIISLCLLRFEGRSEVCGLVNGGTISPAGNVFILFTD